MPAYAISMRVTCWGWSGRDGGGGRQEGGKYMWMGGNRYRKCKHRETTAALVEVDNPACRHGLQRQRESDDHSSQNSTRTMDSRCIHVHSTTGRSGRFNNSTKGVCLASCVSVKIAIYAPDMHVKCTELEDLPRSVARFELEAHLARKSTCVKPNGTRRAPPHAGTSERRNLAIEDGNHGRSATQNLSTG